MRRRARVYYSLLAFLTLSPALAGGSAEGQVGLTTTPAMTRGPAKAPVTIVEFSDYQ
jgi:protein-disulfide isomerase